MSAPTGGFQGRVFRIHHKTVDPLSTASAKKSGGRFNRAGQFGVLYASLDRKTAEAEVGFRMRLPMSSLKDFRVTTIAMELGSVLDLSDPHVQKELGITPAEIASDRASDKAKLLNIADKARAMGHEAILSPSARDPKGRNLNVYLDMMKKSSRVRVVKTESL